MFLFALPFAVAGAAATGVAPAGRASSVILKEPQCSRLKADLIHKQKSHVQVCDVNKLYLSLLLVGS